MTKAPRDIHRAEKKKKKKKQMLGRQDIGQTSNAVMQETIDVEKDDHDADFQALVDKALGDLGDAMSKRRERAIY